jgi:hypothetical protein
MTALSDPSPYRQSMSEISDQYHALEERVRDLEQTLSYTRALATQERQRAEAAERSARRAWSLVGWRAGGPRRDAESGAR